MKQFKSLLTMESGDVYIWRGCAEDKNHAEGLAIADATKGGEQVLEIKYTCYQRRDGVYTLCEGY